MLEAVLDFHQAKDAKILVHPEENWKALCDVGADNKRNLCATGSEQNGDVDKILEDCDYVVEGTYHTQANQQAMMETFRTYTYMDTYGRLERGNPLRRLHSMCDVSLRMRWIYRSLRFE